MDLDVQPWHLAVLAGVGFLLWRRRQQEAYDRAAAELDAKRALGAALALGEPSGGPPRGVAATPGFGEPGSRPVVSPSAADDLGGLTRQLQNLAVPGFSTLASKYFKGATAAVNALGLNNENYEHAQVNARTQAEQQAQRKIITHVKSSGGRITGGTKVAVTRDRTGRVTGANYSSRFANGKPARHVKGAA